MPQFLKIELDHHLGVDGVRYAFQVSSPRNRQDRTSCTRQRTVSATVCIPEFKGCVEPVSECFSSRAVAEFLLGPSRLSEMEESARAVSVNLPMVIDGETKMVAADGFEISIPIKLLEGRQLVCDNMPQTIPQIVPLWVINTINVAPGYPDDLADCFFIAHHFFESIFDPDQETDTHFTIASKELCGNRNV